MTTATAWEWSGFTTSSGPGSDDEVEVLGVIPARMAALRFPGKPLVDLAGRPLVRWVYEAAASSPTLDRVVVATPDQEIVNVVRAFGGEAVLTGAHHPTGTDRVAEVADATDADVVVNVQGDQPFVTPAMLEQLVAPFSLGLAEGAVVMTTLGAPLRAADDAADPNVVKVVCDSRGDALYFSRSPIPYVRQPTAAEEPMPVLHHLGLYAFSRPFLSVYQTLAPTPLERCEHLEQLRALEHGYRIRVSRTEAPAIEVNTPGDLAAALAYVATRHGQ
jgi:3-deoxy-manno-octulosonate cytidylyltransferase (CMP-KDO synthetase)